MPVRPLQAAAPHLTAAWRRHFIDRLLTWYSQHRRDLPWRKLSDPYAIWISESMLQQTQVATVIGYFQRFMQRFPTVESLARATEEEVLAMWAGLGYYRRARQLHAAAQQIVQQHAGQFPTSLEELQQLPGIGRYTAGAIASFAWGHAAPIVEANTERLYSRLLKLELPGTDSAAKTLLWSFAQWQLESGTRPRGSLGTNGSGTKGLWTNTSSPDSSPGLAPRAGQINQAVMELGSLICKPVEPQCLVCPVMELCPTAKFGLQARIPPPKPKRQFTNLHHVALVIQGQQRWLLRLNPPGAWWTGLWDFPRLDVTELGLRQLSPGASRGRTSLVLDAHGHEQIIQAAQSQLFADASDQSAGSIAQVGDWLLSLSHGVTRYRIWLDCYSAELVQPTGLVGAQWQWADRATLSRLPLTATAQKMADRLC
ncbi:MAG: A/G-specific adenine glycosylase [Pirellulaceae bacterium]|nr:A/G-specific adenine glycosylase [Pirellulaceae bacterium]